VKPGTTSGAASPSSLRVISTSTALRASYKKSKTAWAIRWCTLASILMCSILLSRQVFPFHATVLFEDVTTPFVLTADLRLEQQLEQQSQVAGPLVNS